MVFKEHRTFTKEEVVAIGKQILERFNQEGPEVLKDPEVRKLLANDDGFLTPGHYLAGRKSGRGIQKLKMEFARDMEILRIGSPRHPIAFTLAYNADGPLQLEMLKNEEVREIADKYGWTPLKLIRGRETPEANRLAEQIVLEKLLRRSGDLEPPEIRQIARTVRNTVKVNGTDALDNSSVRPYLFASMSNGWTVAHNLLYVRDSKFKDQIMEHFAGDKEILSIATKKKPSDSWPPTTIESMLRERGDPQVIQKLEDTLNMLKRE